MAWDLSRRGSPGPPGPVEDYLRDIEAHLPRWRGARRRVLAEIADGLDDATQHYVDRGDSEQHAIARAIHDSGPAPVVAAVIAEVLAVGQARRVAMTLLLTGPLVGLLWLITLVPGQPPSALLLDRPEVGVSVLIAALFAGLTVAATSAAASRLPLTVIPAVRTAAVACAAATVCDVALLIAAVDLLANASSRGWSAAGAGIASALRLALAQRVARRDLVIARTR